MARLKNVRWKRYKDEDIGKFFPAPNIPKLKPTPPVLLTDKVEFDPKEPTPYTSSLSRGVYVKNKLIGMVLIEMVSVFGSLRDVSTYLRVPYVTILNWWKAGECGKVMKLHRGPVNPAEERRRRLRVKEFTESNKDKF
jgi:hypothetical protein